MSKIHRFRFSPKSMATYNENGDVIAEAPPQKVASLIYGGRLKDVGLMPPALRWLAANGSAAVIERPPHQRHIAFNHKGTTETYTVWLPWLLWAVKLDGPNWNKIIGVKAFARSYPLSSEHDVLGLLPFPGVKSDGSIRMPPGSSMSSELKAGMSFGAILDRVPDLYFGQLFDDTIWKLQAEHVPSSWPTKPQGILRYMTTLDQHTTTFTDYKPSAYATFGDLINELEPPNHEAEPDALEYLGRLVKQAGEQSDTSF